MRLNAKGCTSKLLASTQVANYLDSTALRVVLSQISGDIFKPVSCAVYFTAEVIVNYLASHVLLVYNESRQKAIIRVYDAITRDMPHDQRREYSFNSTIPDDQCKPWYNAVSSTLCLRKKHTY